MLIESPVHLKLGQMMVNQYLHQIHEATFVLFKFTVELNSIFDVATS